MSHPAPKGSRFNSSERGAWYAGYELETAQSEVAYQRRLWLQETAWEEEDTCDYLDYLADFHAQFHDLRQATIFSDYLSTDNYTASQALGAQLLKQGSAGIVYPSVRRSGGTCLVCFRPVLATNVRQGDVFTFTFFDPDLPPKIRRTLG